MRTGYEAVYRFNTAAGDVTFTGRLVSATPGAGVLAGPHQFTSSDWDNGELPRYGEVKGTRRWRRLEAQPVYPGSAHGTSAQLAGDEPCTVVPRIPNGDYLRLSMCPAAPPPLPPVDSTRRGDLAWLGVLVAATYLETPAEAIAYYASVLCIPPSQILPLASANTNAPKGYIAWNAGSALVVIEGSTNVLQVIGHAVSSGAPPVSIGGVSGAAIPAFFAAQFAGQIRAVLRAQAISRVMLSGHSYGGSVAQLIAAAIADEVQVRCVTFGAPRFLGASTLARLTQLADFREVRTVGDIVPYLPPLVQWFPWIFPLVPAPLLATWQFFFNADSALYLLPADSFYAFSSQQIPPAFAAVLETILLTGMLPGIVPQHRIEYYVRCLAGNPPYALPDWLDWCGRAAYLQMLEQILSPGFEIAGGVRLGGRLEPLEALAGRVELDAGVQQLEDVLGGVSVTGDVSPIAAAAVTIGLAGMAHGAIEPLEEVLGRVELDAGVQQLEDVLGGVSVTGDVSPIAAAAVTIGLAGSADPLPVTAGRLGVAGEMLTLTPSAGGVQFAAELGPYHGPATSFRLTLSSDSITANDRATPTVNADTFSVGVEALDLLGNRATTFNGFVVLLQSNVFPWRFWDPTTGYFFAPNCTCIDGVGMMPAQCMWDTYTSPGTDTVTASDLASVSGSSTISVTPIP